MRATRYMRATPSKNGTRCVRVKTIGKLARGAALAGLAGLLALGLTACFLPGGSALDDPEELAKAAVSAADYSSLQQVAAAGRLEVQDLEESGEPSGAKALFVNEWQTTLPDGTVVTWTHVLDDRDTPDDPEDDVITVTRSYDVWNGEVEKTETITRPRKPEAHWTSWVDDRIVQEGDVQVFADGVLVRQGTITATWERGGDRVYVAEAVKECYRPDRAGAIERIVITVDRDGLQTKTSYRIRLTVDGEVIVHSFTYEEFLDDGEVLVKIIREDGWYLVVRSPRNPRITEHYDPDGRLTARVTETRDGRHLDVVKEFFDAEGNLIATRHVAVEYRFLGDRVVITRTCDNGRTHTIVITEDEDGYTISRNGYEYGVKFIESGVELYDAQGSLIATVIFNEDGSCTVTKADGTETLVEL